MFDRERRRQKRIEPVSSAGPQDGCALFLSSCLLDRTESTDTAHLITNVSASVGQPGAPQHARRHGPHHLGVLKGCAGSARRQRRDSVCAGDSAPSSLLSPFVSGKPRKSRQGSAREALEPMGCSGWGTPADGDAEISVSLIIVAAADAAASRTLRLGPSVWPVAAGRMRGNPYA